MAHLLGSKNCLESLARDVEDIQATIGDALEKVGPIRVQSWKFPDKLSIELDINDLIDTYSHSNDEDYNRLSHIVLFELVIDRFVFLLHAASYYLDRITSDSKNPSSATRPKSKTVGATMSVGLVVKKFWSKTVQTGHNIQQMNNEIKNQINLIPKMEDTIVSLREENEVMRDAISSMRSQGTSIRKKSTNKNSSQSNVNFTVSPSKSVSFTGENKCNEVADITVSVEDAALAKTLKHASVQTLDTAFVPCEACSRMQQNLLDVGASVIALCESQGLPSALAKQKKLLQQSLMAATDVSRWAVEQSRDIERINKHLDNLYAQIDPLRSDLEKSRQLNKQLQEQLKDLLKSKEGVDLDLINKENDFKEKIALMSRESEESLMKLQKELGELTNQKKAIEGVNSKLKNENAHQRNETEKLIEEKTQLSQELLEEVTETKRLKVVEKDFHVLKEDLNFVRGKLYETEIELSKSETENKALAKHDKALQSKQEALLQRADQLDQECEELQNRINELEEEREVMLNEYETLKDEKETSNREIEEMKVVLTESDKEKARLEDSIEQLQSKVRKLEEDVRNSNEQLRLLSEFPILDQRDFNITNLREKQAAGEISAEEISEEMMTQIKANNARIAVLEDQNNTLRDELMKYEQFQTRTSTIIPSNRVRLWASREPSTIENRTAKQTLQHEPRFQPAKEWESHKKQSPRDLIPDSLSKRGIPSSPKPPSKPRPASSKFNEKRQAYAVGASLANSGKPRKQYESKFDWKNLKTLQSDPADIRSASISLKSKENSYSDDGYKRTNMVACPDCDKMYSSERDLEIHKSFCYGKS